MLKWLKIRHVVLKTHLRHHFFFSPCGPSRKSTGDQSSPLQLKNTGPYRNSIFIIILNFNNKLFSLLGFYGFPLFPPIFLDFRLGGFEILGIWSTWCANQANRSCVYAWVQCSFNRINRLAQQGCMLEK